VVLLGALERWLFDRDPHDLLVELVEADDGIVVNLLHFLPTRRQDDGDLGDLS